MDTGQVLVAVLVVAAAYLIGGIPFGVVVARVTGGPDPRTVGSGRTGGANTMRALGLDSSTAPWVRARVDSHLTAMLRHFGLDRRQVRERFRSELRAAQTRCAACTETARCRRFLAESTGSEAPSAFCPNAPLLSELLRRSLHPRPAA